MKFDQVIARNSKGRIVNFVNYSPRKDLIEIISIPNNIEILYIHSNKLTSLNNILPKELKDLYCENNNIKQLPDLKQYKSLSRIDCDICCFELYMLEMKNTEFEFYC